MDGPLIVQSDLTVLVEAAHPRFEAARECLSRFAELVKSPEHVHTYRITPLSLWNAASAGDSAQWILDQLASFSRYPLPPSVISSIRDYASRYGKLALRQGENGLVLDISDPMILRRIEGMESLKPFWTGRAGESSFRVPALSRGRLKHALIRLGYPVRDLAGYAPGAPCPMALRSATRQGRPFGLREYQKEAAAAFLGRGPDGTSVGEDSCPRKYNSEGGSGVVTLPCGAGKTVVAMGIMAELGVETLILAANVVALRQWKREILDKTDLPEEMIGEYSGERKEIRPITLATYQILTHCRAASPADGRLEGVAGAREEYPHFDLFNQQDWGLIVYDEVHLLPAPIFQITALLQAKRRLGLTATLIREDGQEDAVFSLIGPKKFDLPWKTLEAQGWIAQVECFEIRVAFSDSALVEHATSDDPQERFRLASENPVKEAVVAELLERHRDDQVLIIGQYLSQLRSLARRLEIPVLTGQTAVAVRERLFQQFREGRLRTLIVSSIANFALDLPDAGCAVQISGKFGSRQEEAQRLGRILRPKPGRNRAVFYTLVTQDSEEQSFARHRQLFLAEQGYKYSIAGGAEFVKAPGVAPNSDESMLGAAQADSPRPSARENSLQPVVVLPEGSA